MCVVPAYLMAVEASSKCVLTNSACIRLNSMATKGIAIICGANMVNKKYALLVKNNTQISLSPLTSVLCTRHAHTHKINKNLLYITNEKINITADLKTMKLNKSTNKPLCIMLNWLLASNKQVMKYAQIYLEEGFDVLKVNCEPWQLLWPKKGAKIIGRELLELMYANDTPYMVHGFSVGGYVWSEAMVYAMGNKEKYQPALDRVEAQVWDSVADITEIAVGVPLAVFPDNKLAQKMTKALINAYLKAFYRVGTVHYERACETYYASPCRAPALFLLSSTDPVGNERRIRRACDLWIQMGIQCTWQCWPRSSHVQHYLRHPEQYGELLRAHIRNHVTALQPRKRELCRSNHENIRQQVVN